MTEKRLECKLDKCIRACGNYRPAKDTRCDETKTTAMCDLFGCPTEYHGPVPPKAYIAKQQAGVKLK